MNLLYVQYPSWIHPTIFPESLIEKLSFLGLFRWYGLMYIFAFVTAFYVLRKVRREGALDSPTFKASDDDLFSFIAWGIIFLLLGARIFSTLVYTSDGDVNYWRKPWLIFWPFRNGKFTGLAGMSYHGGFIGGLLGMILWCIVHKKPLWKWVDAMCVAIPAGYTFGRLGNFLNGELYGRITTAPWGMVFPGAERFSKSLDWVKDFASQCGMDLAADSALSVNLPRHPSQLYEALFEGLFVFLIIWCFRKKKPFDGFLSGLYTISYGVVRFVIEYFRQPDANMGFKLGDKNGELYTNVSLLNISTGQILCFLMILGGIAMIVISGIQSRRLQKQENK